MFNLVLRHSCVWLRCRRGLPFLAGAHRAVSLTPVTVFCPGFDEAGLDGPGLDGPDLDGPDFDGAGFDGPGFDGPDLDGPDLDGPGWPGLEVVTWSR